MSVHHTHLNKQINTPRWFRLFLPHNAHPSPYVMRLSDVLFIIFHPKWLEWWCNQWTKAGLSFPKAQIAGRYHQCDVTRKNRTTSRRHSTYDDDINMLMSDISARTIQHGRNHYSFDRWNQFSKMKTHENETYYTYYQFLRTKKIMSGGSCWANCCEWFIPTPSACNWERMQEKMVSDSKKLADDEKSHRKTKHFFLHSSLFRCSSLSSSMRKIDARARCIHQTPSLAKWPSAVDKVVRRFSSPLWHFALLLLFCIQLNYSAEQLVAARW